MNNIDYTEDENSTPILGNKIQYVGIQKMQAEVTFIE